MPPRTTAGFDVEIVIPSGTVIPGWATLAADTPLGLMLERPTGDDGKVISGAPLSLADAISAQSSDSPLSQDLSARVEEDWSGGVGISYGGAYSVYTRTPGYALPAGLATAVQVALSTHDSNSPLVAFAEYNGDLYIAQEGLSTAGPPTKYGRVLKLTGGTGAAAEEAIISITAGMNLTAGTFYIRDLLVADDGAGTNVLFASASNAAGPTPGINGVLYRRDAAGVWTNSTTVFGGPGANGRNRMAYVHWTTGDGNPAWRIVTISGPKTISYTLPDADPRDDTPSWVEGVKIGTTGSLLEMAAFRRHVYFGATDDLYDINELAESQSMTSYLRRMLQTGNGYAIEALNSYVYIAVGRGVIRVYVGGGDFSESPLEGQCAPGWGTSAENEARGYVTALCVDQGYLVAAVYNPSTAKSYIYWGIDRRVVGVQTPNPLVWYGPEVVVNGDYKVTRMVTSGLAGDLRLWIALQARGTGVGAVFNGAPSLYYVSLPIAGSPIQDLVSGGAHRFATGTTGAPVVQPNCILESLLDSWDDKAQKKILYQHDIGSRGTSSNVKITFSTRADPNPAGSSPTFGAISPDVTTPPIQSLVPSATVEGYKTQWRAEFNSNSSSSPAILDSVRTLAWKVAPSLQVVTLPIQYGDGVPNIDGTEDQEWAPDFKTAALKKLTELGRVTIRDRQDQRWTAKFRQILDGGERLIDGGHWGKQVKKRVQVHILAGPL